jgi:hypothetical protein
MAPPPVFYQEMRNAMPGISDMALQEAWIAEQQHIGAMPQHLQANSSWASEFKPADMASNLQSHQGTCIYFPIAYCTHAFASPTAYLYAIP